MFIITCLYILIFFALIEYNVCLMLQLKVSDEDDYAEVVSGPGREPRPHHTPVAQPNREANYVAIDHRANKLNQQRPDA